MSDTTTQLCLHFFSAGDDFMDDVGMLSDGSVSDFSDEDEPKIKEIKENPDQGIHYVAVKKKAEGAGSAEEVKFYINCSLIPRTPRSRMLF